jgi:hypothetical protein
MRAQVLLGVLAARYVLDGEQDVLEVFEGTRIQQLSPGAELLKGVAHFTVIQ